MGATACCGTKTEAFLPQITKNDTLKKVKKKLSFQISEEEEKQSLIPDRLKFLFSEELVDKVENGLSIKKLIISRIFSHREEVQYSTIILNRVDNLIRCLNEFDCENSSVKTINTITLMTKCSKLIHQKITGTANLKKEHERNKSDKARVRYFFGRSVELYFFTKIFYNNSRIIVSDPKIPATISKRKRIIDVIFLEEFLSKIVNSKLKKEKFTEINEGIGSLTSLGTKSFTKTNHSKGVSFAKLDISKSPKSSLEDSNGISFSTFNNLNSATNLGNENELFKWIREEIVDVAVKNVLEYLIPENKNIGNVVRKKEKTRITIIISQVNSKNKIQKVQSLDEFQFSSASLQEFNNYH